MLHSVRNPSASISYLKNRAATNSTEFAKLGINRTLKVQRYNVEEVICYLSTFFIVFMGKTGASTGVLVL